MEIKIQAQDSELCLSQATTKRANIYVPGKVNGKWSEEENRKYIAFIDFHKEQMRSKEKRNSNKFYREMSRFIETRNALQCRSHHQKIQEKYIHIHKIISIFKQSFTRDAYKQTMEELSIFANSQNLKNPVQNQRVSVGVQTDLGGLNNNFFQVEQQNILITRPQPELNLQYVIPQMPQYSMPFYWQHPYGPFGFQ